MFFRLRLSHLIPYCIALLGTPASGQILAEARDFHSHDAGEQICVTTRLLASEEERQALASPYDASNKQDYGRVLHPQSSIGDTLSFQVRQKVLLKPSEQDWETQEFVLKAAGMLDGLPGVGYQIWVEVGQLEIGKVDANHIDILEEALARSTPGTSFDPSKGIIANNFQIFGLPPDIDMDGIIDVLLTDIVEGQSGATVAGFFDPVDQSRLSQNSNRRDILYLDTSPSIRPSDPTLLGLLRTAAHELQHLVHWKYDNNEELFVNEGQSEWAQVLNGYGIRTASYLLQGRSATNVQLVSWADDQSVLFREYQRAGLWASFIADQLGVETAGSVTREPADGATGYRNVFAMAPGSPLLESFVLDFHTANLVNDASLDTRFSYVAEQLLVVSGLPDQSWSGGTTTRMEPQTIDLAPGGVVYLEWRSVKDFTLNATVASEQAERVGIRLITYREHSGVPEWVDLSLTETEHLLEGSYDRILAIVARTDLLFGVTPIQLSATWDTADIATVNLEVGGTDFSRAFRISDTFTSGYATRFAVPQEEDAAQLRRVWLPNYFVNQFISDEPPDAERDFRFVVLAPDDNGMPGSEIFGLDIEDERSYAPASLDVPIQFYELDLSAYGAELSALPDTVFIGSLNKPSASDSNDVVVVTTRYNVENVSFIRGYGPWQRMWDISLQGGGTLNGEAAPVRAEFVIGQSTVVASPDTPSEVRDRLLGNYPNPFSGRTTVSFSVSDPRNVTLDVYDVTGKHVARLLDNSRLLPGEHAVAVDATGWAPGIYACVLQLGKNRRTRMMTVIR